MTATKYTLVRCKPEDKRVVERALYSHTAIVGAEESIPDGRSSGKTVLILQTAASDEDQARYLSAYQAGRLESFGCFYVDGSFDTYTAAEQEAGESFDAYPTMVHTRTPAQHLAREFGTDVSEWEV